MSSNVRLLFEIVVNARRRWVEAQELLDDAQRINYIYGLELAKAMQAEGVTTVTTHDGVTLSLTDDEERWENNPLDNLEDDDD